MSEFDNFLPEYRYKGVQEKTRRERLALSYEDQIIALQKDFRSFYRETNFKFVPGIPRNPNAILKSSNKYLDSNSQYTETISRIQNMADTSEGRSVIFSWGLVPEVYFKLFPNAHPEELRNLITKALNQNYLEHEQAAVKLMTSSVENEREFGDIGRKYTERLLHAIRQFAGYVEKDQS